MVKKESDKFMKIDWSQCFKIGVTLFILFLWYEYNN